MATIPAIVLASAVAAVSGRPSPLEAVAEWLMAVTPVDLASFLLLHLAAIAHPAALLGALALTLLAGGVSGAAGEVTRHLVPRRPIVAILVAGALLAILVLALIPPPDFVSASLFVFLFTVCLAFLAPRAFRVERREILRAAVVLGGAGALLGLDALRPLFRPAADRQFFRLSAPDGLQADGLSSLVTPPDRFYVMDKVLDFPEVGPPDWRLTVDGQVARPLDLDLPALRRHPPTNRFVTLECVDNPVGGPLIGNALWTGVPLAVLLNEVAARGDTIVFHGADGYEDGAPRTELEQMGALVAYAMNGRSLPRAHGYPARLVLPGVYGFKSVKWLERISVVRGPYAGEWHRRGWTETALSRTTTRIDVARRQGDRIQLAGVAFAGARGIQAVEVRVQGGPWRRARLGPVLSATSWVQWMAQLEARSPVSVEARAIDGAGHVQPGGAHGAYPEGASGWATVTV